MKMTVEIEPICPFVGKECIKDGWQRWDQKIVRPCAFWNETTYNGVIPDEPCRLKRAINKVLADEMPDTVSDESPLVPWPVDEKE